jgi:hypothetical protein
MPEFDLRDVKGRGAFLRCQLRHLAGRREEKLGPVVDEASNEPGAGYAVDMDV